MEHGLDRVSRWTARFVDAEIEHAFGLDRWDERARATRRLAVAGAAFFVLGFGVDVTLIGTTPRTWWLLGLRIATAGAILGLAWWMTTDRGSVGRFDGGLLAIMVLAAGSTCLIIGLTGGDHLWQHGLTVLVMLLVYYLFLPARVEHATIAAVGFSVAFLVVALPTIRPPAGETAVVVLYLALVNVLGAMALSRRASARRTDFATQTTLQRAHDDLVEEVERRARAERALAESEARYRHLVELGPDAILVHRDGGLVYANSAALRLVGAGSADDVAGMRVFEFVQPADRDRIRDRIRRMQENGQAVGRAEVGIRTLDGREVYCEVVSGPVPFEGGTAVQSVIRDVGDRRLLEDELRRLATTDPLTGVCNRRQLFDQLRAEWSRAARHGRHLAVLMIDVDRFKRVNDSHGHAVGDEVLCAVVERFRECLRSSDAIGRLGGEEFAAVLPEIDRDGAAAAAERIRDAVARAPVETGSGPISLTVSVGATECRVGLEDAEEALKRGDDALYEAKELGRDRVVVR